MVSTTPTGQMPSRLLATIPHQALLGSPMFGHSANEPGASLGMNHSLAANKILHNEMQEWSSGELSKEKERAHDSNGLALFRVNTQGPSYVVDDWHPHLTS